MDTPTTTLDEPVASSPTPGNQTDAPAASSPAPAPTSLDEVCEQFASEGNPPATDPDAAPADQQQQDASQGVTQDAPDATVDPQDPPKEDKQVEDKSLVDPTVPPPFHEHPRWKEQQEKVRSYEPLANAYMAQQQYLQANGISEADHRGMLEIGALMYSNPEAALQRLKPIYDGLAQSLGHSLPPDLEALVAEGKMDPSVAKQTAKERAQGRMAQAQLEQQRQANQATVQRYMTAALNDWTASTMKRDPSFKNGTPMWEMVTDRFQSLYQRTPPQTPQDVTKLAEQAYQAIKKVMAPAVQRPVVRPRSMSSNGTSPAAPVPQPQDLDDVAMAAMGVSYTKQKGLGA